VYANPELYKLDLNESMDSAISVMQCTAQQGLPSNAAIPFLLNSGEVVFCAEKGIFCYHTATNTFEQYRAFSILTGAIFPFQQQKNEDIWFQETMGNRTYETGILKYNNGNYQLIKQPFYKFTDYSITGNYDFYVASDSEVFICTSKGLLQYNPLQKVDYNIPYNTLIRTVFAKDSLLFGGATVETNEFENIKGAVIPYTQNNLVFHYAATFYEDVEKNLYSYRLIGSDTSWSDWVSDVKKEYTFLKEGKYTFEVKSKNQYKVIGKTASYSFRILPPWYRTWWAYTLYVLFFLGLSIVILKLYTRRLVAQKEHLEQIVKERTAEVVQQKEELSATLEIVNQQNEEISQTLEIVNHQKDVIEKSHKNITASITYAKRIQTAVLPSLDVVTMLLPEHFILFKPRDIVSGDFYFIKQIKNYTLIAAADCTGHGVPGAFMSMLGVALLNEIVRNTEITSSAEVLNELRKQIKFSLQQTGQQGEQQDGMDIAFCSINIETLEMNFAGAFNPCLIFRKIDNGQLTMDNELINKEKELSIVNYQLSILEADRMPVGIHLKEKPFTELTFQLQTGDVFYIFSDGYESQFGGVKPETMKSKRFKEFLTRINHLPMNEQKEMLEKRFDKWRGNNAQTDDVLVMGVKI